MSMYTYFLIQQIHHDSNIILETGNRFDKVTMVICLRYTSYYQLIISLRSSGDSEVNSSELRENIGRDVFSVINA